MLKNGRDHCMDISEKYSKMVEEQGSKFKLSLLENEDVKSFSSQLEFLTTFNLVQGVQKLRVQFESEMKTKQRIIE